MNKKSIRLTNDIRDNIKRHIMEGQFSKERKQLKEREHKLSELVYEDIYGQKTIEKMYSLPEGWLPERRSFYVQFGTCSSGYCYRRTAELKRVPNNHNIGICHKVYDPDHELTKIHDKLTLDLNNFNEMENKLNQEVYGILSSFTTTKKLKEYWPEITGIVEKFEPDNTEIGTQVAPILATLNDKLGLSNG